MNNELDFFPPSTRSNAERRERCLRVAAGLSNRTDNYLAFGFDYFDNPEMTTGYGGYKYDGRFAGAAKKMVDYYKLQPGDRVLEIGCAKGFLLVEFQKLGMEVSGVDASAYAIDNAHPDLKGRIKLANANLLPFEDDFFDLVICKDVLPHMSPDDIEAVIRELMRVKKHHAYFEIEIGRTETELRYLKLWDETHLIVETPEWWDRLLTRLNFDGDRHYKVLIPERDE